MAISFNLADAVSGLFAKILGSGVAPQTTDNAVVVLHRPDDPLIAGQASYVIGQGAQLALGQNVVLASAGAGAFDVGVLRSVSLEIVPAAGTVTAGAITFEGSNDGANFVPIIMYDRAAPAAAPVSTYNLAASTPRYFVGDVCWKYFRARISTGITGTTTGVQCFSLWAAQDFTPIIFGVRQTDGTNVAPTMDAAARRGYFQVSDGTNSPAIKAASTPVAAADPTLAVAQSPNLPTASKYSALAAATNNAANIKGSAGKVLNISVANYKATAILVKLYNKATAPVPGTDTPLLSIIVPATSSKEIAWGVWGKYFATGIGISMTGALTDADNTSLAANDCRVDLDYI
jgi:hypothetical protein